MDRSHRYNLNIAGRGQGIKDIKYTDALPLRDWRVLLFWVYSNLRSGVLFSGIGQNSSSKETGLGKKDTWSPDRRRVKFIPMCGTLKSWTQDLHLLIKPSFTKGKNPRKITGVLVGNYQNIAQNQQTHSLAARAIHCKKFHVFFFTTRRTDALQVREKNLLRFFPRGR